MVTRGRFASHQLQTTDGAVDYLAAGDGEPLLAFHGALGNAESMEWFINAFARDFRVIVPSLGDRADPALVTRCVAAVLAAEGIRKASVFGISFGGLVAQLFLEQYPEQVRCLILMSCPPLRDSAAPLYAVAWVLARLLPLSAVKLITRTILTRRLAGARGADAAARRALRAHRRRLHQAGRTVSRETLVARLRLAAMIHGRAARLRRLLGSWNGDVLLMIADDDPLCGARARRRLRAAFPAARIHTFEAGGHVIPLFHAEAMRELIGEFVRDGETHAHATA